MKTRTFVLLAASATLWGQDPSFTPQERANVIQLLKDSRKEMIDAVKDLTDEQWKWKPAPNRWSVGEVAEHIVLAEGSLFGRMQAALDGPPNPDWATKTAGKTELILKVMAPRLGKAQAPEAIVPQGKMTRAEVMARFDEGRAKTLRFAEETKIALKEHTSEHPFAFFGTLNAYQWLIYIPLHNMRHDKQIEEVKATAGFPK
ncbi:MAG: DinB family protein [Acidobacteriota bacterium]|nr:DinB family protein [Acidobacteriota bacterium]